MPEFTYKDNEKVALTIAKDFLHANKISTRAKDRTNAAV
jgi:hypothetical protein